MVGSKLKLRVPILVLMILLIACEKQVVDEVSNVNGRSISHDDFIFAYETSPSSFQTGPKERAYKQVLDRIIQRILLSQEAQKRGLHTDEEIAEELRLLEDAAIRRELFRINVREQVQISNEVCRQAFSRGQQTLWVRHAVLGSKPAQVLNIWDSAWTHSSINPTSETYVSDLFGKVDLVRWNDLDQELEEILFGLEINELSAPILRKGNVHIFQLVNIETNQMVSENSYLLEKEHYRATIQKRREHAVAFSYVKDIMEPQNLIIRREALDVLSQVLWSHNSSKDALTDKSSEIQDLSDVTLDEISNLELANYQSGTMSVGDFRTYYKMNPIDLSQNSLEALQYNLTNAIGIYVRDIVFAEIGRREGLTELPEVSQDYQYWQERLLAARMETRIFQEVQDEFTNTDEDISLQANERLNQLCAELKQDADIKTDTAALMEIKTSDAGLPRKIDFFASYLN